LETNGEELHTVAYVGYGRRKYLFQTNSEFFQVVAKSIFPVESQAC